MYTPYFASMTSYYLLCLVTSCSTINVSGIERNVSGDSMHEKCFGPPKQHVIAPRKGRKNTTKLVGKHQNENSVLYIAQRTGEKTLNNEEMPK